MLTTRYHGPKALLAQTVPAYSGVLLTLPRAQNRSEPPVRTQAKACVHLLDGLLEHILWNRAVSGSACASGPVRRPCLDPGIALPCLHWETVEGPHYQPGLYPMGEGTACSRVILSPSYMCLRALKVLRVLQLDGLRALQACSWKHREQQKQEQFTRVCNSGSQWLKASLFLKRWRIQKADAVLGVRQK